MQFGVRGRHLSHWDYSPQLWKSLALIRKGRIISHVPMQDIHLVYLHQIQGLDDGFLGQIVSGGVNHKASVRKSRSIFYVGGVDLVLKEKDLQDSLSVVSPSMRSTRLTMKP